MSGFQNTDLAHKATGRFFNYTVNLSIKYPNVVVMNRDRVGYMSNNIKIMKIFPDKMSNAYFT